MSWLQFGSFPLIFNLVVFIAAGLVVWLAGMRLSTYADSISVRTLSQTFLGIALLGVATSLAEMATTITAAKIGNSDLIEGNLFGGVALQITVLELMVVRGALTYFTSSAGLLFQGAMLLLISGGGWLLAQMGDSLAQLTNRVPALSAPH